nr:immunoglobulin light chain junction region [Macaca mulatta]MOX11229.1 immunoglobulin light chain junction region [Macaca mulatta]MOX11408.1 immunoglobulin light chain junction region [Macaca mulatta]MOX11422.1 immunoglobulin light chain junction region [Macaca mulatta]MOX11623.1 immunoglobulin light chain junction region [Macaca mulatta]
DYYCQSSDNSLSVLF